MIDKSCTDPPWMSVVSYIIASKSKETVQKLIVDQWKMLKDRIKRSFWGVSSTFFNQLSYTPSYKNIVSLTVFIV